jgi:hypothetical protein
MTTAYRFGRAAKWLPAGFLRHSVPGLRAASPFQDQIESDPAWLAADRIQSPDWVLHLVGQKAGTAGV